MIGEHLGILDLGSNSFHLLIAQVEEQGFEVLLKHKNFVRLAEEGIGHISEKKYAQAMEAMQEFSELFKVHNVKATTAVGTACLRAADNGAQFIQEVKEKYDISIELIDGQREAELIYKGIRTAVDLNSQPRLLMDIGGGSTEFIIANQKEIFWKRSYPIGAGVLKKKFHHSEPIAPTEYKSLTDFLNEELSELWQKINEFKPVGLVGSSGSFKSLINIQRNHTAVFPFIENTSEIVNLSEFKVIHLNMLKSNLEQRIAMAELEAARAPLMTVATTLISTVLSHLKPQRSIMVSKYSLKEGLLAELSEQLS